MSDQSTVFGDLAGAYELGKPLFKSDKEYQEFCDNFYDKIAPELEDLRIKRLRSEQEALIRIVN